MAEIQNEKQKRVLFLSITAGQGHNSASKAVADYLESRGVYCEILDTYVYLNKFVGQSYDKGYTVFARYHPKTLESICKKNEKVKNTSAMKRYFPYMFADLTKKKMAKYIEEFQPDYIVCPHVITCIMMTQLRKSGLVDPAIPLVGIITDYTLHVFWECTQVDYFIVGADFMVSDFERRGVSKERVKVFGIPVQQRFENKADQSQMRAKLGLRELPTVLMLSGGMGMGKETKEVALELGNLSQSFQIVIVCGSNKTLKKELEEYSFENPNVHVLGFIHNVDEYMDASDIVFTKPGGLTTSEALTKDKPLLLMKPLPGVEEANQAYFTNSGLAMMTNKYLTGSMAIEFLMSDTKRMEQMREARERLVAHHSAKRTGDFILSLHEK